MTLIFFICRGNIMISFAVGTILLFTGIMLSARIINTNARCEDRDAASIIFMVLTLLYSYLLIALGIQNILNLG